MENYFQTVLRNLETNEVIIAAILAKNSQEAKFTIIDTYPEWTNVDICSVEVLDSVSIDDPFLPLVLKSWTA